jgi:hypothetical protein
MDGLLLGREAGAAPAGTRLAAGATEGSVPRTRGMIGFTFIGPNGERSSTVGPSVEAPLE